MNKQRLVFIGLYGDANLGDPIIASSTQWIVSHFLSQDEKTKQLNLFPRFSFIYKVYRRVKILCRLSTTEAELTKTLFKYYTHQLESNDFIIVVGGGLIKYKYQYFHIALASLLKAAKSKNAKVVFNSVGIEGYDETSPKCQILKRAILDAIQSNTLIYFSTRDDIDTLQQKYLNKSQQIPCLQVADPAVWCAEAFNIHKKNDSQTIGIGIIRGNIFIDNDIPYDSKKLFQLYISIAQKLYQKKIVISLFTNGLPSDNIFAQKIQKRLQAENIPCELKIPTTPYELIHIISQFKGLVTTRLHSCIIAYSLNIPAVGLVWNDKLTLFGRNIKREDNFISYDKFNTDYIIQQLEKAIKEGYPQERMKEFKQTIKDSIKEIVALYKNQH